MNILVFILFENSVTACRFVFVDTAAEIIAKLRESGCTVSVSIEEGE